MFSYAAVGQPAFINAHNVTLVARLANKSILVCRAPVCWNHANTFPRGSKPAGPARFYIAQPHKCGFKSRVVSPEACECFAYAAVGILL